MTQERASDWADRPDDQLVKGHLAGEAAASRELFVRYAGKVYALGCSLLRDREEAEDVVQETFLSAFRSLGKLRDPERLRHWLYRIGRNCCMEHANRARREKATLAAAAAEALPGSGHGRAEKGRGVSEAVASLPEIYRVILSLKYLEGLSHSELAELLDMSPSGVNTRLYRARMLLRQRVEEARRRET